RPSNACSASPGCDSPFSRTMRLVKRYGNRKLYDTSESRYVTLEEIGRWVKAGEEVKILENDSGDDLTAVTFAQIILEEERRKSGLLSLPVLRDIIRHGEAALQNLAATVDRGVELVRSAPERAGRRVQERSEERRVGKEGGDGRWPCD